MRAFFSTDGEPSILYQSFSDDILEEFKTQCIDYMKGGASTTSIHNPLDRTVVFRDMKAGILEVSNTGVPNIYTILEEHIDEALNRLEREVIVGGIGTEYKKGIKFGLTVITHCMQNGYCTPIKLIHGFVCCGQHIFPERGAVYSESESPSTISFDKIMRQCESELTQDQLANMKRHAPELIQILLNTGQITEEEYDARDIPKLPDEHYETRDELVLYRQRCVIITHDETIARYKQYAQRKADLSNPVIKKAIAVIKRAVKSQIAKETKAADKKRLEDMTPDERDAEKQRKRTLAAANRALKKLNEEKLAEEVENAYKVMEGKEDLYQVPREDATQNDDEMEVDV